MTKKDRKQEASEAMEELISRIKGLGWCKSTRVQLEYLINLEILKERNLAEEHFKKHKIRNKNMIISECCGSEVCNEVRKERKEITRLKAENKELQKEYDIWHPVRSVEVSLDKLKKETRKAYPSSRKERA